MRTVDGKTYYLPFDYNLVSQGRPGKCWFTYGEGKTFTASHPFPTEVVAKQIRLGWKRKAANILLAAAPDYTGRMRPEDAEQLRAIGKILQQPPSKPISEKVQCHGVECLGRQPSVGARQSGRWRFGSCWG